MNNCQCYPLARTPLNTEYIHIYIDTLVRNSILLFFGWKGNENSPNRCLCVVFFERFKFDHIQITKSEYAENVERFVRKRERNIHRKNSIIIETIPYTISSLVFGNFYFSLFLHIVRCVCKYLFQIFFSLFVGMRWLHKIFD